MQVMLPAPVHPLSHFLASATLPAGAPLRAPQAPKLIYLSLRYWEFIGNEGLYSIGIIFPFSLLGGYRGWVQV